MALPYNASEPSSIPVTANGLETHLRVDRLIDCIPNPR